MTSNNQIPPQGQSFSPTGNPGAQAVVNLRHLLTLLAVVAGALIWLWPSAPGPLPTVWPGLFAWTMGIVLFNLLAWSNIRGKMVAVVATGWLVAALANSVVALMQYFDLEAAFAPFMAMSMPGYADANTRQPNHFGTLVGAGLLALLWLVRTQKIRWSYALCMAALLALGMAASASRTGMLHLILITGLAGLWRAPRQRQALFLCGWTLTVYVLSSFALPWALEHVAGIDGRNIFSRMTEDYACHSRKVLYSNMFHLVSLKPMTGWGWGELAHAHYSTLFEGPRFCELLTNAHNLPLHIAVELGVPVAALLCVGLGWLVGRQKPWQEKDPARQMTWSVLLLVGVHSLLEYPLWFGNFQTMVALCIWLLVWRKRPEVVTSGTFPDVWRLAGGSLVALLGLSYVGLDYFRISQLYLPVQERAASYRTETLEKVRSTWLFSSQVLFAQVVITSIDKDNAAALLAASLAALHIAPESRIIEKVIDSARLLGKEDLALEHMALYKAADPANFAQWVLKQPNKFEPLSP